MNDDKPEKMPPVPPFVRFVASAVPMVFDDSLSYYEALCALWKYVQGMTDVINNNATLEEEYIEKFNELKSYVENYFDNLDVQEEINNKLDAMVEDGTLQELINSYLQANVSWMFDTVADMKASTNLINGSYARTLGFHAVNDGGGATYKITNTGTANEMDTIAVGSLYAHLVVKDMINPEVLGAYGDGTHDDTDSIKAAIGYGLPVYANKEYLISDQIELTGHMVFKGDGTFIYDGDRDQAVFKLSGGYNELTIKNIIDVESYSEADYDGGWHGWTFTSYAGILINSNYNDVKFERIINTTVGLMLHADNAGFYKNKIEGVNIYNCKYGIYCLTTGVNGWFNSNEIKRIMISVGSQGTDIATNSASITTYGIYQEISDNTYGMKYNLFDQLFYEVGYKDTFVGCYLTFAAGNTFRNLTSEITNSASFATINMVYTATSPSTKYQQSFGNVFEECVNMGGNFTITYQNMKPSILSYSEVAKFSDEKFYNIFSDDDFCGKTINIDNNNHSSIRGYNIVPASDKTSTLSACILARTNYAKVRITGDNQIIIPANGGLALNLPVTTGNSYRISLGGVAASSADNKNIMLKTYDASGNFTLASSDTLKTISGYLAVDGSGRGYVLKSGYASDVIEFTINDSSIKNVVIVIYGTVSSINIECTDKNAEIYRHWGNFNFLNYLPNDVFYSATIPNSSANTTNTYNGSVVYKAVEANLGEKWTLTGGSWA